MHIGLIGGIGVAATQVYYQRLVAAIAAKGGKADLTIVHADVDTLVANNLADRREDQAQAYAPLLQRLADAGCDCAAITSLGGHFCYPETVALSPLPLISAVSPLDAYFVQEGLGTVGLLGTRIVMQTQLYGQLENTRAVVLDAELDTLGQAYQSMAIAGRATDADRDMFIEAGRRLVTEAGAAAVVLAGTDLGLAFDRGDPGYRVIDALDVHVDLLAKLATGGIALNSVADRAK